MDLFDIKGDEIIVTTEALSVPIYNRMWTQDKHRAYKIFTYISNVYNSKSPYEGYPLETRKSKVMKDVFGEEITITKDIQDAIDKYIEFRDDGNPANRLYESAKSAVHKLADYLDGVDFMAVDNNGRLMYDPKEVITTVEKCGPMLLSLQEIKKKIERDEYDKKKTKGNRQVNYFEK
jgi:hypothetical protein